MALIECAECGKQISDRVESCPSCGCPLHPQPVKSDVTGHGIPALFSFFFPGLGQLVRGQYLQAASVWISFGAAFLIVREFAFFQEAPITWLGLMWTAIWIRQVVDAYRLNKTTGRAKFADWTQPPERITVSLIAVPVVCLIIVIATLSRSPVAPLTKPGSADNIHTIPSELATVGDARAKESHTIGDYEILLKQIPEDQMANRFALEILRDGRKIHEEKAHRIVIIENRASLAADGNPGLVIEANPGGAHSRSTFIFFSLGKVFKVLGKIENHNLEFKDIDKDNRIELIGSDTSFDYWETGYASSPSPKVIFKYSGNGFQLAPHLMRQPAPDQATLSSKAEELRVQMSRSNEPTKSNQDIRWASNGGVPEILWTYMLELIFSGNGDLAWVFFHKAWPESKPGEKAFLDSFRERLSNGEYWPQIMAMNGWKELPEGYSNKLIQDEREFPAR